MAQTDKIAGDLTGQGQIGEMYSKSTCKEWDSPENMLRWQLSTD